MHEIDTPYTRFTLAAHTHIKGHDPIPSAFFEHSVVVIGNYIGLEHGPHGQPWLNPTVEGLAYLTHMLSISNAKNRVLAIARNQLLTSLPDGYAALKEALIPAIKQNGEYHLGIRENFRIHRHLRNNGVLWVAPGGSTDHDGLVLNLRTGSIRYAREHGSHLALLAMETEGTGAERIVTYLHVDHVPLPNVIFRHKKDQTKKLLRQINLAIGRYALARTAALLPADHPRGEYTDPDTEMALATAALRGMIHFGVEVTGGFLE